MSDVLMKAACFIMIIILGCVLKKAGVLKQDDVKIFSKLVIKITLPAAIIYNFSQITMEVSMLAVVLVGFLCSALFVAVGYGLFINGTREEKAFSLLNLSGYNIGCFTMPFVQSFLGPVGMAVTSLFDTGNAMICTGTSYAIAVAVSGKGEKRGPLQMLKQLVSSVPFDCYIIMTLLTLFEIRLPAFVVSFTQTVGNANTFLAMIMIGLGLEFSMTKKQLAVVGKMLGARLVISILLSVLIYHFAPFSQEVRKTLAILMFGPVSSLGVPYTTMIDGDINLASAVNSSSILLGIICLTIAILVF